MPNEAPAKTMLEIFNPKKQSGEVGIEIEMEGERLPVRPPVGWSATRDGSLRGESLEYVLTKPVTRANVVGRLTTLWDFFAECHSTLAPSDRCGVHVHINCQNFTFKQVMNFGFLYLVLEDLLVKWCGEDREGNLFALRAKDAEYLVQALVDAQQVGSFADLQSNLFRYASINFSSLGKYGSVEFRPLRTPDKPARIATWAEMLLAIKDASQVFESPKNIIEGLSGQGSENFVIEVLKDNAQKVLCQDTNKLVMQSVRRLQDIAYYDVVYSAKEARRKLLEDRLVRNKADREKLQALGLSLADWDNGWPVFTAEDIIPDDLRRHNQCILSEGALYKFDRGWRYMRNVHLVDYANPPLPAPVPAAAARPGFAPRPMAMVWEEAIHELPEDY